MNIILGDLVFIFILKIIFMGIIRLLAIIAIMNLHLDVYAQSVMVEIGRPNISRFNDAKGIHFRMSGLVPVVNKFLMGISYGLVNEKGPEEYYHIQAGVITDLHPINTAYRVENDKTLVYSDKFKRGVKASGLEDLYTLNNVVVTNSVGIPLLYKIIEKPRWNYYIRAIPELRWQRSIFLSTKIPFVDVKFNLEDELTTQILYTDKRVKVDQTFGLFIGTGLQYKVFPYLKAGVDFGYDIEYLYPNLVFAFSYTFN